MIRSELSTIINAPPEKVFARISDPMSMLEDWPSVVEVKDVTGEGVGGHFTVVYKMLGVKFSVECTCSEYVPNKRLGSEFKGGINGHDMVTLEPHNGGTKVTDVYEYAIPIPLLGKIAEMLLKKQNEREGELVLANLKARVEAGT